MVQYNKKKTLFESERIVNLVDSCRLHYGSGNGTIIENER